MFLGTHTHKLDDKGRLTLPAKFREQLSEGMMVTLGQDRSLAVYPPAAFVELADRAGAASKVDDQARSYYRFFMSNAEEMAPDGQGRITLSGKHRDYAGLTKSCEVIGVGEHVEIWDTHAWHSYQNQYEESFSRADNPALGTIL